MSVGRLLAKMGMSPQRPLWRAYQQDPGAVQRWKEQEYPAIAAAAAAAGATIYFADEAGIRSDHHAGTTWAPAGQTPVVKITGARFRVNMISAVTARGALRFAVSGGTTTAGSFTEFCKRLVHDTPGPVYLIVDGHPAHRSRTVKDYAASTAGKLTLFYLPGYSPELNPDEWVWKNVKHDRTNAEMDSASPFAGILAGQPTLNRQLRMGMFAALDQRIATRFVIKPMDLAESAAYLRHHLKLAGARQPGLRSPPTPART